jgi:hypothetical protein
VNGFELGEKVSPHESYIDGMDGTFVIASESNMLNKNETLHISLQGSGSDLKKDIHDMWHTEAIFDLNLLRPTVFKMIDPILFRVKQCSLSRAIIGRTHTEDSARQKT